MAAKKILKALYDIRPVNRSGDLDIDKISSIQPVLDLSRVISADVSIPISVEPAAFENDEFLFGKAVHKVGESKELSAAQNEKKESSPAFSKSCGEAKEIFTENVPTRDELLAELLAVEEKDKELYLKHQTDRRNIINLSHQPVGIDNSKELSSQDIQRADAVLAAQIQRISAQPKQEIEDAEHDLDDVQEKDLSNRFDEATVERIRAFREQIEKVKRTDMQMPLMFTPHQQITREEDVVIGSASLVHLPKGWKRSMAIFAICAMIISSSVPAMAFIQKGLEKKNKIMELSQEAYESLNMAKQSTENADFAGAGSNFDASYSKFAAASGELSGLTKGIADVLGKIPGLGMVESGEHLLVVGQNISSAGKLIVEGISPFAGMDIGSAQSSLTGAIFQADANLRMALDKLKRAQSALAAIDIQDLPAEVRESVLSLKEKIPVMISGIGEFLSSSSVILEILGHYGPKKYLFIFQNPNEMRATGGFIGTYGVVDINRGYVNSVFIDGIYNPDGQLRASIVPPKPIQKISANWSMHDANWFADYPDTAEKVAWFYEKTGGPTVDGVFAMTPFIIEKLLRITGPIEMPEYDTVITAENFVENVMYEVEVDYDKELNQPKKIISDLAPILFNKIFNSDKSNWKEIIDILLESLEEKHILLYFFDEDVQGFVAKKNWDGRVMQTEKDYLSVINSNINGYKSDGMIEEEISHEAEVQPDGSIVDTVVITRRHAGGASEYDWWNKVNADYMRVFVPLGSELISAKGHTKEADYDPPVDYADYMVDPDVSKIENTTMIDAKTGTRISEESGKTVFANWVYVSPGEEVVVEYRYKLPFKVDTMKGLDKYILLVQKQSGSEGSGFVHSFETPAGFDVVWSYPEDGARADVLNTDKLYGVVIESVK